MTQLFRSNKTLLPLVIGLFFFICFASIILFIKKDKGSSFQQLAQTTKDNDKYIGLQMFHHGAYGKIKDLEKTTACPQENKANQLMCLEGYNYVKMSKFLNAEFNASNAEKPIIPVELESIPHAIGTGIALSFLRKTPEDIQVKNSNQYIKYVYDGWGQREVFIYRHSGIDSVCKFKEHNDYCLFGLGRGIFFLDLPTTAHKPSEWVTKGYLFARVFGGGQEPKNPISPSEQVAMALRQGNKDANPNLYDCVFNPENHNADCQ